MTDQEFRDWLRRDGSKRCVLVELDYRFESAGSPATGTLYLSDREYFDASQANAYIDCVNSVPQYSRALSGDLLGSYTSSIGTLEIDNADGDQDSILDLAIDGSEVRFYLGDASWPVSDFRLIFSAFSVLAIASSFDRISITLKDTGLLLNQSIGGAIKVGGTGPNADQWRPVNFGLVHQVECKVLDQPTLGYVHSDTGDGLVTAVDAFVMTIRDKGVPVVFTDNGDGTFNLAANPAGTITADLLYCVPGPEDQYRCVSDAMSHFVGDRAGLSVRGLYYGAGPTYDERPATGVKAWLAAGGEDYQIGVSISDKRNVIDLLSDLTDSGLCFWAIRRDGKFTFGRLRPNYITGFGVTSSRTLTEDDIDNGTFRLDRATPTYFQLQATMSKNWSIQTDLATSLSPDERAAFTRTGLYAIQDDGVGDDYANAPERYNQTLVQSPQIETLLSGADDTTDLTVLRSWMETRLAISLPWLTTASMTVGIDCYDAELGDVVTVALPRFGYDAGVDFQVISINIKLPWKIDLRLLRRDNVQSPYGSRPTEPPDGAPFSGPARIFLAVASFIVGLAFATAGTDGLAVGRTLETSASFIAGTATGNGGRGGEGGFGGGGGGGGGGGSGSVTSLTATAPIVVTPDPITGTGDISHDVSGVSAGTYGDDATVPQFTVDADGHITDVTDVPISFPASGVLQSQEFTSGGTWTRPTGVTSAWVTMIGGGGGGSSTIAAATGGGGGGAGELVQNLPVPVSGNVSISIGTGGGGGASGQASAQAGAAGGTTSFGSVYLAKGGSGGLTTGASGAGGGASGAVSKGVGNPGVVGGVGAAEAPTYFGGGSGGGGGNTTGANGGAGGASGGYAGASAGTTAGTQAGGGGGASTVWGIGGAGGNGGSGGSSAASGSYGSGGGGGGGHATTTVGGGNGAPGYCLVQWIA